VSEPKSLKLRGGEKNKEIFNLSLQGSGRTVLQAAAKKERILLEVESRQSKREGSVFSRKGLVYLKKKGEERNMVSKRSEKKERPRCSIIKTGGLTHITKQYKKADQRTLDREETNRARSEAERLTDRLQPRPGRNCKRTAALFRERTNKLWTDSHKGGKKT